MPCSNTRVPRVRNRTHPLAQAPRSRTAWRSCGRCCTSSCPRCSTPTSSSPSGSARRVRSPFDSINLFYHAVLPCSLRVYPYLTCPRIRVSVQGVEGSVDGGALNEHQLQRLHQARDSSERARNEMRDGIRPRSSCVCHSLRLRGIILTPCAPALTAWWRRFSAVCCVDHWRVQRHYRRC